MEETGVAAHASFPLWSFCTFSTLWEHTMVWHIPRKVYYKGIHQEKVSKGRFLKESIRKRCAHDTSHLYLQWMFCYQTSLLQSYKPFNFSYFYILPKPQLQKHVFKYCPVPQVFLYSTYLFLSILSFCSEPYFTMHTILQLEFHQSDRDCFTQKTEFISSNSGRILIQTLRY